MVQPTRRPSRRHPHPSCRDRPDASHEPAAIPCRRASAQVILPVPVVIVERQGIGPLARRYGSGGRSRRRPSSRTRSGSRVVLSHDERIDSSAAASRRSTVSPYTRLTATTRPANQQRIPVRDPVGRVLPALLVAVHLRGCQREVPKVPGELGLGRRVRSAQSGIVCLAGSHDVFDISLASRCETRAGVRPVHRSQLAHDVALDGLGVRVIPRLVVRGAAVLGGDGEAPPRLR